MSDYIGGPGDPQRGPGGYSQPAPGPGYGPTGQPVSGPGYEQPIPPVYPSQASQVSPYQQPAQPVSGYPGYPGYPVSGQPGYAGAQPGYAPGYPPGYAPGYPPQFDAHGRPLSDKSRVIAGVLGITLGGFGVGRFYTGHTGIAVAQLVVTLVTCGLGHFWGLIDGILLLTNGGTDAQGRVLRD
jgi:TM2 domain-containing membrane protein YozV